MNTLFGLMAEFDATEIPLDAMAEKYLGLSISEAKSRAALSRLPVPAYRLGSQKSPWLVSAKDLADYIDLRREKARKEWKKMNG